MSRKSLDVHQKCGIQVAMIIYDPSTNRMEERYTDPEFSMQKMHQMAKQRPKIEGKPFRFSTLNISKKFGGKAGGGAANAIEQDDCEDIESVDETEHNPNTERAADKIIDVQKTKGMGKNVSNFDDIMSATLVSSNEIQQHQMDEYPLVQ